MEGLISGPDIKTARRARRGSHVYRSVPHTEEDELLTDGWELVKRNNKTSRMRAPKSIDDTLEDEVWCLLADMNFSHLSEGRHFRIKLASERAHVSPKANRRPRRRRGNGHSSRMQSGRIIRQKVAPERLERDESSPTTHSGHDPPRIREQTPSLFRLCDSERQMERRRSRTGQRTQHKGFAVSQACVL